MPNRLAHESSPYLLQHANNPVDWYPWNDEAIQQSRETQKPIFLSIGYSACHWCHVMEHESFESATIAQLLNDNFVCIKVDREERPDLDQIYMHAVMMMNAGRGGWPMSVFLTPKLQPFFGGTYWPPHRKMGMPGFDEVIYAVLDAWNNRRDDAIHHAQQVTDRIEQIGSSAQTHESVPLTEALLLNVPSQLERAFDDTYGGFGAAPKFPHSMDLQVLLRVDHRQSSTAARQMVTVSLDRMAAGGIYDHLGGGFARYSVDARWLVPHFEKMLYDNSLLASAYLDSHLATGNQAHARIVRETLDYLLRDMTDEAGGFYSTEDADSEGVEGKFYVWSKKEILDRLGEEVGEHFCTVYDVSEAGNFEGQNILNLPRAIEQVAEANGWELAELESQLAAAHAKLFSMRETRVRPGLDDKVIVCWNGLAIDAFARAARVFDESRYRAAAEKAASFLFDQMREPNGRLLHCWRNGKAKLMAYLDDYAALGNALVSLYEANFDSRWIDWATELADLVLEHFSDPDGGAFFYTADDHEQLITRNKDMQDGSVPSGNSLAACLFVRLGKLTGRTDYLEAAEAILMARATMMQDSPSAVGQLLLALDGFLGPFHEIVVLGDRTQADVEEVLHDLGSRFLPRSVVVSADPNQQETSQSLAPVLKDKTATHPPTVYLCQDFSCQKPQVGKEEILAAWQLLSDPS